MKYLSLNLLRKFCERFDEISVTQFVAKVLWKNVMYNIDESLLKVCDAWCVESLLKNHPQILMNVVKWMLWSECEICSSYIFHNLSEYMEVFWLICYRSSFKNVCHYNCWRVCWRSVTIIVEWNFVTIIVEWNFVTIIVEEFVEDLSL